MSTLRLAAEESLDTTLKEMIETLGLDNEEVITLAQERALYMLKSSGLLYNKHTFQMFTAASIDGMLIGYNAARKDSA